MPAIIVRVDEKTKAKLVNQAAADDRSLESLMRIIIKQHLKLGSKRLAGKK
jgi:plasmid stability protein